MSFLNSVAAPTTNLSTVTPGSLFQQVLDQSTGTNPAAAVWPTANTAILVPIETQDTVTVYKMLYEAGAAASGNVDLGIYDARGNRLTSSGSTVEGPASSVVVVDVADVTLTPGTYFLAMAVDNVTANVMRYAVTTSLLTSSFVRYLASTFPLPTTVDFGVSIAPTVAFCPQLGALLRSEL